MTGISPGHVSEAGERQPDQGRRQGDRLGADRPELQQARVFSSAAVVGRQRVRRDRQRRLEPGADQRQADPRHHQDGRQEERGGRFRRHQGSHRALLPRQRHCLRIVGAAGPVQGCQRQPRRREADQGVQRRQSAAGVHAEGADSRGCGDGVRQRPRPAHQPGVRRRRRPPAWRRLAAFPSTRRINWSPSSQKGPTSGCSANRE